MALLLPVNGPSWVPVETSFIVPVEAPCPVPVQTSSMLHLEGPSIVPLQVSLTAPPEVPSMLYIEAPSTIALDVTFARLRRYGVCVRGVPIGFGVPYPRACRPSSPSTFVNVEIEKAL